MDIYLENPYPDRCDNFVLIKKERVSFDRFAYGGKNIWTGDIVVYI